MTWYTVVAIAFGLAAPVPSLLMALRLAKWASEAQVDKYDFNPRALAAWLMWLSFAVTFVAYTGHAAMYGWQWFYTMLHSTPVELPK
jgi:hypothetical protein